MGDAILTVRGLDKSFGGVHAVNNVSFEIRRGEILGLIGPNRSGKSATVNLISGTIKPDQGEILFEDRPIMKLSPAQRANLGVCRTFQTPKAFTGLITFDSVMTIALQRHSSRDAQKKAEEILDEFDLLDSRNMFSERLLIKKRTRLGLARTMAIQPKLIMLDEVMAGLNPSEMETCIRLVRKIREKNITILFIEHVMKAISALCERRIVLSDGHLLCEGAPNAVLNDPKVVEVYLGKGK